MPVAAINVGGRRAQVVLDARLERDAAERGHERDAPARELVACRDRPPSRAGAGRLDGSRES